MWLLKTGIQPWRRQIGVPSLRSSQNDGGSIRLFGVQDELAGNLSRVCILPLFCCLAGSGSIIGEQHQRALSRAELRSGVLG